MTVLTSRLRQRITLPNRAQITSESRRYALMLIGIFISALGYASFQVPHNISAGGIGSLALIGQHFTGLNVGLLFWMLNVPMITLGYFLLGGWKFVGRTLFCSTLFSLAVSGMLAAFPVWSNTWPITDNLMLSTIYGAVLGGVGGGLIYRAGASTGGSGVLALVLQKKTGLPISTCYLIDDGLIIVGLGLVFGWENALYGGLMLLLNGYAADFAMEGPSTTRTATIVTNRPKPVAQALMATLNKGVSYWEIRGGYSDESHYMLTTTIYRNQVADVQKAVSEADDTAFVTIGISHKAHGGGFLPLRPR